MSSLLRGNKATGRSASADSLSAVLSSRPPQPASKPQDNNTIKFKVTQLAIDNTTQTHILSLDTRSSSITLSAPLPTPASPPPTPPPRHPDDSPTQPPTTLPATNPPTAASTWPVADVADIEKCHCTRHNNRAILVFFDDTPYQPVDLAFLDRATRDIFCELVASTDRGISIKNGCGGFVVSHWVEDGTVRRCGKCNREFGVGLRRHHCRLCGRVFCWSCSDNRASLPDLGYSTPVRVCEKCFNAVRDHRVQGMVGAAGVGGGSGGGVGLLGSGSGGSGPGVAVGAPVHNFNGQHAQHNVEKRQQLLRKHSSTDNNAASQSAVSASRSQTERREDDEDGERVEHPSALSDQPSSTSTASVSVQASTPSAAAMPNLPPLLFSHSSASPRGFTPRDGAFRSGKRDKYGFIVGGEGTRGQDDRPYHLVHQHKQRKRWNQYLAMHPQLDKTAELRKLVRKGVPHELRGPVWQVLSGSNERQAAHPSGYYRQLVTESKEKSNCATEIEKDLRRTFPDNHLYESEEGLAMLRRVLLAYSVYNPTIGYCQSMNFITALCLLFMEEEPAFWLLTYIVEELTCIDTLPATSTSASSSSAATSASASTSSTSSSTSSASSSRMYYYQADLAGVHIDQAVFADLLADKLPRISAHFASLGLSIGPFTVNWFLCLFVNTLPLETALHVWDCMFSEGPKTLFRCALALMKVNEKSILQARDFEAVLLKAKHFHLAAVESVEFAHVMFDDVWLGTFPMSRIEQLRRTHRAKIVEELEERRRQLELNESEQSVVRPSQMARMRQKEEESGREQEKKEAEAAEADRRERGRNGEQQEEEEVEEKRAAHTTAMLSSSLRAQLHLSEAALADPFAQLSPTVHSPTNADESDPQYEHRFSSLQQYLGPEHSTDVVEGYIVLKGEERKKEAGSQEAAEKTQPAVDVDEDEDEDEEDEEEDSEDYVTVEKPRAHSSATPPKLPSPSASTSKLPWRKPTLPSRIKSASLSSLPPSASASGPHGRRAAADEQRRTNSGQSSPSGESASLFAGWKSMFNRGGSGKSTPKAQTSGSRQPQWSGSDDGEVEDDLPSPGPAQQYVRPASTILVSSSTRAPATDSSEDESSTSSASTPSVSSQAAPRGGPIFRRTTDSPTSTQRAVRSGPIHPRTKPSGEQ